MLSGDEFIRRVVPSLSRLFASSDRNLRRNLLESIDTYGQHLTTVSCSVLLLLLICFILCCIVKIWLNLESINPYGQHLTTVRCCCCVALQGASTCFLSLSLGMHTFASHWWQHLSKATCHCC